MAAGHSEGASGREPDEPLHQARLAVVGEYPAVPASVRVVREALAELATRHGAPPHRVDDVRLAVSEAATNSVVHAYQHGSGGSFRMLGVLGVDHMVVVVEDDGCGLAAPAQTPGLGAGLQVMQQVAEESLFRERDCGGSSIQLRFALTP